MPQLRQVEYEFIYQVFDHLTELGGDERALEELIDESNGCPPYRLISLKSSDPLSTSENLVTALHLCPELQSVALTSSPSFQESALWNLNRLSRLCDLSLANGPSAYSMDFYTSIVPVLQAVGHQLNNLILTRFTCVDIQGIFKYLTYEPVFWLNYFLTYTLINISLEMHLIAYSYRNGLSGTKKSGPIGNLPFCASGFDPTGTLHSVGSIGIVGLSWRSASNFRHQATNDSVPACSKFTLP